MTPEICPAAPFDFGLTCWIFTNGDPEISKFEAGTYWQVLRTDDKLALLTLRSTGTIEQPKLIAYFEPELEFSTKERQQLRDTVVRLFNLSLDLTPFYRQARSDQMMFSLTRQLMGLRSPTTPTPFEALISSIIEQQISLRVAETLETNLIKTYGDRLTVNGKKYYAFPTPENLGKATETALLKCGLSRRKAEYIKSVSWRVYRGDLDLEELQKRDSSEIIEVLDAIRGIGLWTAELAMIRGMQKFDAMPADDLGLRRTIAHYYAHDNKITSDQARKIAENWGKWKGLASYYLIVAAGQGLKAYSQSKMLK